MKRLLPLALLSLLLFCAAPAWAQGYTHRDLVLASTGRPVAGATITVCTSAGTGIPCTPLATIYTNETLGTGKANPFTTDGRGNFDFSVPFGATFVVTITGPQITGYSYRVTTSQPTTYPLLTLLEGAAPAGAAGNAVLYGDSTTHRLTVKNDNGAANALAGFTDKLSVFAATSSAELAGVLTDESGASGVFTRTGAKLDVFAGTTSAELATVVSDETGSGGGFVRATSPTITGPTITGTIAGSPTITSPTVTGTVGGGATYASPTISGTELVGRTKWNQGTALVAGDFALDGNWGTSPSVSSVLATDGGGRFSITTGTGSPAGNAGVTLTFKDGTWTNAPSLVVSRGDGFSPAANFWAVSSTATTATFTFVGTAPVASTVYTMIFLTVGR